MHAVALHVMRSAFGTVDQTLTAMETGPADRLWNTPIWSRSSPLSRIGWKKRGPYKNRLKIISKWPAPHNAQSL
jgi:hypothetical protein